MLLLSMMKYFLYSLPKNVLKCFTNYNWIWHIVAIILTSILVLTNADWYYFLGTRSDTLMYIFFPAVILGALMPIAISLFLIVGAYFAKKKKIGVVGFAIAQAALIGSIISSVYKAFTGRIQPNLQNITNDISHNFNFGFLRHGIFWGWPSSHTMIAFSMAFTLIYLFPKNKIIRITSFIYALYIGIGVSFFIHWFSECLAGAIMGIVVGSVVAKSYKGEIEKLNID